jgi:hypothetical protein
MSALYQHGGVYLDIDTICVRPWRDLLGYQIVLGREEEVPGIPSGICNAVMMARPRCKFLAEWMIRYPFEYNPDGWREASIILPFKIASAQPDWLTLKGPETFFTPGWHQYRRIFSGSHKGVGVVRRVSGYLVRAHYEEDPPSQTRARARRL